MTNRLENFAPQADRLGKRPSVDRSDLEGFQRSKDWVLGREKLMDEALAKMDANKDEWRKTLDEFNRISKSFEENFKKWEELVHRLQTEEDQLAFERGKEIAGKYNELVSFLLKRRIELNDELEEFSAEAERLEREFYTTIVEMEGGIPGRN